DVREHEDRESPERCRRPKHKIGRQEIGCDDADRPRDQVCDSEVEAQKHTCGIHGEGETGVEGTCQAIPDVALLAEDPGPCREKAHVMLPLPEARRCPLRFPPLQGPGRTEPRGWTGTMSP